MPYFNANPGPSIAASIASRYGRARSAKERAQEEAKQKRKDKFVYRPPREEFVFYYPKAPSFESQIEKQERAAHGAVYVDAVQYAEHQQQQQQQQQPQQRHGAEDAASGRVPAVLSSPSAPRQPAAVATENNNNSEMLLSQPQAVAPYAVDSGRGSIPRASPSRGNDTTLPPCDAAASGINGNKRTEYKREYHSHDSVPRVPVDRGVELILQRGGMSNLKSKAAAAQQRHGNAGGNNNQPWDPRPKKPQPEVTLQMAPPPPAPAAQEQRGQRGYVATTYYRPKSASNRNDIAPQPRSVPNQHHQQKKQVTRRPASAGATPAAAASIAAHHSIPSSAPQTSTGARAASPAVRRSQSVASCGSARYHANCAAPVAHGYQARRQLQSSKRNRPRHHRNGLGPIPVAAAAGRSQVVAPIEELPSTRKFVPVPRTPRGEEATSSAARHDHQHGHHECGCPCHALQEHNKLAQANLAMPMQRRQLHRAPNFQTSLSTTRTGVGACMEWPIAADGSKLN